MAIRCPRCKFIETKAVENELGIFCCPNCAKVFDRPAPRPTAGMDRSGPPAGGRPDDLRAEADGGVRKDNPSAVADFLNTV